MNKENRSILAVAVKSFIFAISLMYFKIWQSDWFNSLPGQCRWENVCWQWQFFAIIGIIMFWIFWLVYPNIKKKFTNHDNHEEKEVINE